MAEKVGLVPPCPLCRSLDIQLIGNNVPSKRSCKCRECGCSAPVMSWISRAEKPWKEIGYIGFGPEGEQKFTEERKVAGMWFDLGWNVSAIFDRIK